MTPDIIEFIINPPFQKIIFILKIISIGISLILFIFIIFLLKATSWLQIRYLDQIIEFFGYKPIFSKKGLKQWLKIKERLETNIESEYKLAIIEADAMLDDVLKKLGYKGESFGERLENLSSDILPNLNDIKNAHKIRNNIVYDPDYKLTLDEAKRIISIYEKALINLEVI